jgi:hypothetical protein
VTQKSFRLEERLRRAKLCQDTDLAKTLLEKLTDLTRDVTRARVALEDHQAQAHPLTSAAGGPTFG